MGNSFFDRARRAAVDRQGFAGLARIFSTLLLPAFAFLLPAPCLGDTRSFSVELEAGPVWQSRNEVRIPNDPSATRFSLVDFAGNGPWFAWRAYVGLTFAERHSIRLLLAPLSITEKGEFESAVGFAGESFDAGPASATYRFNSWRATYRYLFGDGEGFDWWLGFTAKIRDAEVRIEQEALSAEKTDLGFVPLLHLAARYRFAEKWKILLDLDALAGGPGRAEDFSAKIACDPAEWISLSAGYRTVEGGADVDEVYSFAWLHYLVLSLEARF